MSRAPSGASVAALDGSLGTSVQPLLRVQRAARFRQHVPSASSAPIDCGTYRAFIRLRCMGCMITSCFPHFRGLHRSNRFDLRSSNMRRLLFITAAATALTAGALTPSAVAAPLGLRPDLRSSLDDMNPIQNVAICFYIDGWNGPGLYDCGFRHRRGHGWHGRRDDHHSRGHNDHGGRGSYNDHGHSRQSQFAELFHRRAGPLTLSRPIGFAKRPPGWAAFFTLST